MKRPFSFPPGNSSELTYEVSSIPDSLKNNADVVVREYSTEITISSLTSVFTKVHKVLTVLRESGLEYASLVLPYDQFSDIKSIKAIIYNENGIETKHAKSSQILDESAIPDGLLFTEDRVKKLKLSPLTYPFTVEYSYEIDQSKIIDYPRWMPQDDYRISVEHSRLTVTAEEALLPRFKEFNLPQPARITKNKELTTITYEVQNLPAVEEEKVSIPLEERVPVVHIAPVTYRMVGMDFDFRSWKSIGLWVYTLNKDRDILPEKTRQQLSALIKDKKDDLSKMKAIYRFVQETTRYVCVILGIGGMQTAEAKEVAEKDYGDCKGLVNYTQALLKEAGITSYATLVKAGRNEQDIITGFPSDQFDHVILCVPQEKDTVWLECTSQYIPFNFLGDFTDNRHVLVITPEGGVLVKTPAYPASSNTMNRRIIIGLDSLGNATAKITAVYRGLQYEDVEGFETRSIQDMKDFFIKKIKSPSATITKISYSYQKDHDPHSVENAELSLRSFATHAGNRIFLPFSILTYGNPDLNRLSTRKTPLYFRRSSIDSDTIEIHLPAGYSVESLPESADIPTQFGHYKLVPIKKDDMITFIRTFEIKEGRYPPESFTEFTTYLQKISKSDKSNAVLIKR
jgi:hypothetical protein